MRRACVAYLALAAVAVGLVGCGRMGYEQREPWRSQAEEACLSAKLVTPSAYMSRAAEIDGPGTCGISYPFKISAFASGTVALSNKVTLGCPIIPEIDAWLNGTVQPAAEMYFGTTVTDIKAGSYSCRGRNNQAGAKTSEHGFGNALDVMSFKLADGRWFTVERGWKGAQEEQGFLREVFIGACRHFTTVLAPGSDVYHYNHFHLDLARHDPRGRRRICKPLIKFEPRLDPERNIDSPAPPRPRPVIRRQEQPAEPLDLDEEGEDPYAVSAGPSRAAPVSRVATGLASPPSAPPRVPSLDTAPVRSAAPIASARQPTFTPGYASAAPPYRPAPVRVGPAQALSAGTPLVLQPQLHSGTTIY